MVKFKDGIVLIVLRFYYCRPLDELLMACQEKVQRTTEGGKFRTEELLQMVCELTVHPETYTALVEIFDSFAPVPANYMSDEEIEGNIFNAFLHLSVLLIDVRCFVFFLAIITAADVVKPARSLGIDPIGDELLERFGDHDLDLELSQDSSFQQPSDEAVDFRDRLDAILHQQKPNPADPSNQNQSEQPAGAVYQANDTPAIPKKVTTRALHLRKVVGGGGILGKDLTAYFMQEDSTRRLSNMGFYEKDNFMDFD